jgi:DNA-binding transcriptional LysR family regulator
MLKITMRITQLRKADLNLLVVFTALAEERSGTRAAARLFLSQPALSRALQRLRHLFRDDLLIRTVKGYEPTPRGERLLHELTDILPRLDRLISGAAFDPQTEHASFRIAATDNASHVLAPQLSRLVFSEAKFVSVNFFALQANSFEDLEHGRLDLALNADDGHAPDTLLRETLYEDEFICVVAKDSRYSRGLTLKQYVDARHIGVGVFEGRYTIPDQRLAALGLKRRWAVEIPFFTAAMRCIPGTNFVATVPRRLADLERHNPHLKMVRAPREITGFKYQMVWHPRLDTDAAHRWLRQMVRSTSKSLEPLNAE